MTMDEIQAALDGNIPFSQLLGTWEGTARFLALIGAQSFDQGRYEDARSMFQGAASLESTHYSGHAGLGALALMEDDLEGARTHLLRAYSLHPQDASLCANLGEVFLRSGETEQAARFLKEASALDPESSGRYGTRARGMLRALES